MKQRSIPFGYQFEMGKPAFHPSEASIVRLVFQEYLAGASLKQLSEKLTEQSVEYLPGQNCWDKARVKRLLENRKYLGDGFYPQLVSETDFERVQAKKKTSNTNKLELDPVIRFLKPYVICHECGKHMSRRVESRLKNPTVWKCQRCGQSVRISDEELKAQVLEALNFLIAHPESAVLPEEPGGEVSSLEARRIEQDFHRALDRGQASEDELINMILECAAKNYESIIGARHISDRLEADFSKRDLLPSIDTELFARTVSHIRLAPDGKVKLELQNGKVVCS